MAILGMGRVGIRSIAAPAPTSPIITNGLILNLDAGNAASYPGTGTTWTDLSGNGNNATLYNGATYSSTNGGIITFDGINDYSICNITPSILGNNPISINIWQKQVTNQSGDCVSVIYSGGSSGIGGQSCGMYYRSSDNYVRFTNWGANDYSTGFVKDFGVWHYWSIVFTKTSVLVYRDGIADSTGSRSCSMSFNLNQFVIGAGQNPNLNISNITVGSVQVYNRVITASEIQQNFNATKTRFGL